MKFYIVSGTYAAQGLTTRCNFVIGANSEQEAKEQAIERYAGFYKNLNITSAREMAG